MPADGIPVDVVEDEDGSPYPDEIQVLYVAAYDVVEAFTSPDASFADLASALQQLHVAVEELTVAQTTLSHPQGTVDPPATEQGLTL